MKHCMVTSVGLIDTRVKWHLTAYSSGLPPLGYSECHLSSLVQRQVEDTIAKRHTPIPYLITLVKLDETQALVKWLIWNNNVSFR